jgi:pimeloyl-ACP methyl ester carboxylesterase
MFAIPVVAGLALLATVYVPRARALKPVVTGESLIEEDALLGFAPRRSGASFRRFRGGMRFHVYTDRRGARVTTPGDQTAPRVSLLTVGCSFSWGHGLENEATYTERLRERLGIDVANFAFGSFGTVQSVEMLRRNLDLRPRVVVYGFISDHLNRNLSPCAPTFASLCLPNAHVDYEEGVPRVVPAWGGEFELNEAFARATEVGLPERSLLLVRGDLQALRLRGRKAALLSRSPEDARGRALTHLLREMDQLTREAGAELVVLYIPLLNPERTVGPPPELLDAMKGLDRPVLLDATPLVQAYQANPANKPLHLPDGHPAARAHVVLADGLERLIRERSWVGKPGS